MKPKPQYSLQTKLAALIELERNGGNLYQTARILGMDEKTLASWAQAQREGKLVAPPLPSEPPVPDEDAPLDERLEQIVQQMVAIMPQKLEEASLQELVRSLTMVRATLQEARAEKEENSDVYEKLARLMDRFAPAGSADSSPQSPDGA